MEDTYEGYGTNRIDPETSAGIRKHLNRESQLSLLCSEIKIEKNLEKKTHYLLLKKYQEVIEINDKFNINPNAIFADISDKLYIFKEVMGYKGLKGEKKKIEDCSDEQLGRAYQHLYSSACKALRA